MTQRSAPGSLPRVPLLTNGLLMALGLLMTVNPVASNIYLPALGLMADELGTTITGAQFALTGFLLGAAGGQLIVGALADSLGRRRVLLGGLGILTLASVLVAAAPTLEILIAGRVLQGVASAAAVVVARAVVSDTAKGAEAARAYSLLMGMLAAGPLFAPLLGTALMQFGGWRIIFVGLIVLSAGYLLIAYLTVPETLLPEQRSPVRFRRLFGNYAKLLRDPGYVGNALAMAFGFGALATHVSASSFIAQDVLGTDEWGFAILYMCYAASVMLGSAVNARLAGRFGARRLLLAWQILAILATAGLFVISMLGVLTVTSFLVTIMLGCASGSAILANATTLTLARAGFAAGSGAALMGCTQFAFGSLISPLGGVLGPHTAVPMALTMLGCFGLSIAAGLVGRWWERRESLRVRSTGHGD